MLICVSEFICSSELSRWWQQSEEIQDYSASAASAVECSVHWYCASHPRWQQHDCCDQWSGWSKTILFVSVWSSEKCSWPVQTSVFIQNFWWLPVGADQPRLSLLWLVSLAQTRPVIGRIRRRSVTRDRPPSRELRFVTSQVHFPWVLRKCNTTHRAWAWTSGT